MILTTQGRILSLTHLGTLLVGIAVGVWWATPETYTVPPNFPVVVFRDDAPGDPARCDTEVVPAPKSKVTLPDGTTIETDEPIRYSASRTGQGRDFAGSGEARGPSLRTDNADTAGKLNLTSGTPAVPMPGGSGPLNASKEGGGSLDIKALTGGGGAYILIVLGAIVFLCGPAGLVLGRKIGLGLSVTEAGIISLAGLGLIGMGMYPGLAPILVLILAGLAAAYGVFYVLKSRKVGKVSARAMAAARMVKAIDEADTGEGSAGDTVKKAVSANVGKGTELEKIIDEIIAEAGA